MNSKKENESSVKFMKRIEVKGVDITKVSGENMRSRVKYLFEYLSEGKKHAKYCGEQKSIGNEGKM